MGQVEGYSVCVLNTIIFLRITNSRRDVYVERGNTSVINKSVKTA